MDLIDKSKWIDRPNAIDIGALFSWASGELAA